MSILQKISLGYFVALMIAASLNYIPGLTDEQGLAFSKARETQGLGDHFFQMIYPESY